jgi:hypothetical protein
MRRMAEQPGNGWGDGGWSDTPAPAAQDRPSRGLSDVLDDAFQAVRRDVRTVLVATALVVTALTLVDVAAMVPVTRWLDGVLLTDLDGPDTSRGGRAAALAGIVEVGTRVLLIAGTLLVSGVLAPVLTGSAGGPALWGYLRPRVPALVAVVAMSAGIVLAAAVLGAVPGLLVGAAFGSPLVAAALAFAGGGFCLLLAAVWVGVRLGLAPQAAVLGGLPPRAALSHSVVLTRGRSWRVLGVLLVAGVLTWVAQGIVSAPFATFAAVLASGTAQDAAAFSGWQLAVSALGAVVSATVSLPLMAAVLTGLYTELQRPD